MDPWFLFFLFVAIGLLAALAAAAAIGLPILMQHFLGAPGGWGNLAKLYATKEPIPSSAVSRQSFMVGRVLYRNCVNVAIAESGLYLNLGFPLSWVGHSSLLVPWKEFRRLEEGRLFWRKAAVLFVGDPAVTSITVPIDMFGQVKSRMYSLQADGVLVLKENTH